MYGSTKSTTPSRLGQKSGSESYARLSAQGGRELKPARTSMGALIVKILYSWKRYTKRSPVR